ncbi:MAG: cation-translocating P-type ATPase [candidate division FCPU426 bacterium]
MSAAHGLTHGEAKRLLALHGPNEAAPRRGLAGLRRLLKLLSEPTLLVLLVVLGFYLWLGSRGEAALLAVFVMIVIAVTAVEEARTESALAALSSMASPRALVMREGAWSKISALELVPGDLLNLSEGDRVPADASILEAHDLKVDESLLTGESSAVWKDLGPDASEAERALIGGSLVLQGQALATVTRTGAASRMGALSASLAGISTLITPFQRSVKSLVRVLALFAAIACLIVVAAAFFRGYGMVAALLQGLTLAIATVPEELPVILAVFLALGARRLSKKGVLARQVPAVETLGAVTLLAVDKTGTLTRNEMILVKVIPWEGVSEAQLLETSAEACELDPFDPMERGILARSGPAKGSILFEYSLFGRPPRMGHVWKGEGEAWRLSSKGAVEGVLEHVDDSAQDKARILEAARAMARQGLRVLGVASKDSQGPVPSAMPQGLRFLGFLAFEDPLREGVKEAIATARAAGMRVVMMTGDSPETASAIARELGLPDADRPIEGRELEAHPEKVEGYARECDVFARLAPEQKLVLVQAWSRQGEVVGMTGDGVNDAPALAQAHVGVGMGLRGTDVAREAADLVLADDSFSSLVDGVRIGRGTTRRILRAALFVLAVHVPIIAVVLACLALGLPPMIEAAQIAFLELFIGPTCSVVFERAAEGPDLMRTPPRDPKAPLLSFRGASLALFQGGVIFVAVFFEYFSALKAGAGVPTARSAAFMTLMLADLMLCWTMLSSAPATARERWNNGAFWLVSGTVMGGLMLLLRLPLTSQIFHMDWISAAMMGRAALLAGASVLWFEFLKLKRH